MNSEEADFKLARIARGVSKDFKRLCLLCLEWQAQHVDVSVLSRCVNEAVFPAKRSPSFSRKVKEQSR
jgi:hypothetical protein